MNQEKADRLWEKQKEKEAKSYGRCARCGEYSTRHGNWLIRIDRACRKFKLREEQR